MAKDTGELSSFAHSLPIHCLLSCFSTHLLFILFVFVFLLVVSPVSSPLGCQGVVGVAPSSSSKCEFFIFVLCIFVSFFKYLHF